MFVSTLLPVVAQGPCSLRESLIASQQYTAVTHRAEVLRGIETGAGHYASKPRRSPVTLSAQRLCTVLDNDDAMLSRQTFQPSRIQRMSIQVDWHHGTYRGVRAQRRID